MVSFLFAFRNSFEWWICWSRFVLCALLVRRIPPREVQSQRRHSCWFYPITYQWKLGRGKLRHWHNMLRFEPLSSGWLFVCRFLVLVLRPLKFWRLMVSLPPSSYWVNTCCWRMKVWSLSNTLIASTCGWSPWILLLVSVLVLSIRLRRNWTSVSLVSMIALLMMRKSVCVPKMGCTRISSSVFIVGPVNEWPVGDRSFQHLYM